MFLIACQSREDQANTNVINLETKEEAPIAQGEAFTVTKGLGTNHADLPTGDSANLLLNDRDEPEQTEPSAFLQIVLVKPPRHAMQFKLGTRGGWQYLAGTNVSATQDSFSYRVNDGNFDSEVVEVQLNLIDSGSNVSPTARNSCSKLSSAQQSYNGDLSSLVYDSDDTHLNYRVIRNPLKGSLTIDLNIGTFRYTPTTTERGHLDSFQYEVSDMRGGSAQGEFTLVVGDRRIMPLGDSITHGVEWTTATTGDQPPSGRAVGYRAELKRMLQAAGYSFDYVGPLSSGTGAGLADSEHAGFSGWKANDLAAGRSFQPESGDVSDWLNTHPADIVLLHAGTNDHSANAAVISPLLDKLQDWGIAHNPTLHLFIANLVDQRRDRTDRGYLDAFNSGVESLVPSYKPNATFVDQYGALDWRSDITNYNIGITGLHPNTQGYAKMAKRWSEALLSSNLLNKCP